MENTEDALGMIAELTEGIKVQPGHVDLYHLKLASAKSKGKDFIGAIINLNWALEIDSNFAAAYYVRGKLRITRGDYINGNLDLNRSEELGISKDD